ncbi:MAG: amidohydrolase family protein [Gammaproteobacteria bacterium]|nr:amidohydrolase family protein [Gammaproteobacteria bacterium]MDP6617116.1 amidohydrolase family protein [Gammaproteobacteria bacterium]MDP6695774.1 amidohydrolase family protein [Gammaproteobacteria bacterium]
MKYLNDPDGERLPIKIDTTTNGEFLPRPLKPQNIHANRLASTVAGNNAKRLGLTRRGFLTSTCGAASTLLAFNEVYAAYGETGGFYDLPLAAALEPELAADALGKKEFIFDIQGHHVNPLARWRAPTEGLIQGLRFMPHGRCSYIDPDSEFGHLECFTGQAFVKEMFLDSDTDIAVLTFIPSSVENMPLTTDEAAATREMVAAMEGSRRVMIHGRVVPNLDGDLDRMQELKETWDVCAWKTYTQYGPEPESGWWLDDEEFGMPLAERAREMGIKVICVHKGLPLPPPTMTGKNRQFGSCADVGRAAKANPDIGYIIYHSGFDPAVPEGPYVPGDEFGVNSLVQSLIDNGIPPNSNVYAELGSTWRYIMRSPDKAAHVLGKLLKYVGEDNVVWGTDCIWYGSPQDQIQAFRSFQIAEELQERHDYPALTPEIRNKVFGFNAAIPYQIDTAEIATLMAGDTVDKARDEYEENRDPTFKTYGPKTRREFLRMREDQPRGLKQPR